MSTYICIPVLINLNAFGAIVSRGLSESILGVCKQKIMQLAYYLNVKS